MIVLTDEAARAALEEVGALQRAIDDDQVDVETATDQIIVRLDAVLQLYSSSTTAYSALVEPFVSWAIHSFGPRFIVDQDSTPESRKYKAAFQRCSDFFARWKHLDPDPAS